MRFKRLLTAILAVLLCMGTCAQAADYNMPYYIDVDITNQIVTIYKTEDNSIVRQMLTSSGENDCTPLGTFYMTPKGRLSERGEWTWFSQYQCWVKFATRIYKGYMFHSLPFAEKDESTMMQEMVDEFGLPASHGCMRLRVDDARFIAKQCLQGTRVRIFKSEEKNEELRQLLYISSYTNEDGMSYTEFLGYSEDSLGRGAAGTEVEDLQCRLQDLGYFDGEVTGSYDMDTISAMKHLQADLGLAQNGIASGELLEVIYSDSAPVSAGQNTLSEGRSGPIVKKLQTALSTLGLYEGDIDGVYDLDVSEAVGKFQSVCGYTVDGVATAEMQQALFYQMEQLKATFGDEIPTGVLTSEDVQMARLNFEDMKIIVRAQPDTESQALDRLSHGDVVILNEEKDEWASITVDTINGYVKAKYLEPFTQENIVIEFSDAGGASYRIGHTLQEYAAGAQSVAREFAAYYASEQYSGTANEAVSYATVNTGSDDVKLNLRAAADSSGEILAEVPNGTSLRVLEQENGWTKVGFDDKIGYLLNDYLSFWEGSVEDVESTEQEDESYVAALLAEAEDTTIRAVVICGDEEKKSNVYASGAEDAEVIGKLSDGDEVDVISVSGDWVLIQYQGSQGYMMDANLQFELIS